MDIHKEAMGPHNKYEGGICAKKGKCISIVKGRIRGGV